jgi:hypothetical protein
MRVTVNSEALDALIRYADDKRVSSDSEFLCSDEGHAHSEREFGDLVAALEIRA